MGFSNCLAYCLTYNIIVSVFYLKDLIHGAPIGKPVASTGMVTAVYAEEDGTEINFTRKYDNL